MTDSQTPVYRQALTDAEHPLHRVVWELFQPRMDVERTAQRLDDQREEVIAFVCDLFQARELYEPRSLGGGEVPYNCIDLMAYWRVESFIPLLIPAMTYTYARFFEDLDFVFDRIMRSLLSDYGGVVLEPVLQAVEAGELSDDLASDILGVHGQGDERCYRILLRVFEGAEDPSERVMYAESLLRCDYERGQVPVRAMLADSDQWEDVTRRQLRRILREYAPST